MPVAIMDLYSFLLSHKEEFLGAFNFIFIA